MFARRMQTVIPNPVKPLGQNMLHHAANKCVDLHGFLFDPVGAEGDDEVLFDVLRERSEVSGLRVRLRDAGLPPAVLENDRKV